MKEQDIIKIRNKCGVLNVRLVKELNLRDVTRGYCEELEFNGRLRMEFHQKHNDDNIITLCERSVNSTKMIVARIEYGAISVFLGEMLGSEEDEMIFETVENN